MEVMCIRGAFEGILRKDFIHLNMMNLSGLQRGGTILGSSWDRPFRKALQKDEGAVEEFRKAYEELGLGAIVCIGGNGTQKTAKVVSDLGFNAIGVSKTIDNDVWGTDITFGF